MNKSDYVKLFQKEVIIPESTEKRLQAVYAEIIANSKKESTEQTVQKASHQRKVISKKTVKDGDCLMNSEQILNSLSNVEQQYINEATPKTKSLKTTLKTPERWRVTFKWGIVAICLLMAAMVGLGSIVAAGGLNKSFGQFFHSLPESNYENMLFDINQSITDNGVTVTLTQGMCDGHALLLIERVEFDPSIVTLTDEMFELSEDSYHTPYWSIENVYNEDYPEVTFERTFSKLIEHDAHSMTWLKTFGGNTVLDYTANLFSEGMNLIMVDSGIYNVPGFTFDSYQCQFQFKIDVKISEPITYHLPPKTYRYDQSIIASGFDSANDEFPDVWINPWYMRIAPASLTGKVIDTSLKNNGPVLKITLNDGTVYTDTNGILLGGNPFQSRDLLGTDYNPYGEIYCTFDTEVDVTNIKSIQLYGYEMTKINVKK